jgi:hypothetical protein
MKWNLCICCIIKDEDYLEEFIIFHYLQGVQHFFIYDNESKIPLIKRLNHYFYKKLCTIIDFPGKVKQMLAYNHCLINYGKDTKWMAFIDGDEFILPKNDKKLIDFLKYYESYSAIAINWIIFGSNFNDYKKNGLLLENYTLCNNKIDGHFKTICKPNDVKEITNPHFLILKETNNGYVDCKKNILNLEQPFNFNYTTDIIQINHYWGKSYQELKTKIEKGRADNTEKRKMLHEYHDYYNDKEDKFIIKYVPKIRKILNFINSSPHIYKILNPDLNKYFGNNLQKYVKHYVDFGIRENRPCTINDICHDFDSNYYQKNYDDLNNFSYLELIDHYITYGKNENRVCNKLL